MIDIKAIRELCDKATPGPWEAKETSDYSEIYDFHAWGKELNPLALVGSNVDDADFIAQSRTLIPALLDELEAAQKRWIPVTERLPENDECVLICDLDVNDGGKEITISAYSEAVFGGKKLGYKRWSEPYQYFSRQHKVTHWMPLPQPPKGEE